MARTVLRSPRAIAAVLVVAFAVLVVGSAATADQLPAPIFTVAGNGASGQSGDGGPAIDATIDRPRSIAPLPDGGYLFVEPFQNDVRRVWPDGTITRFAGDGTAGYGGDGGAATSAQFNLPHSVSLMTDGSVIIADNVNNRIRRVSPTGTVTTVAGNGVAGYSGDGGPATAASINNPRGAVAMPDGGFLIADSNNHRVRRVSASGTITTVAGTGVQGFSGDGGPATQAQLNIAFGVAVMADGGFLIVDVGNQRIRRVSPTGTITTVAGNGIAGYTGDGGPATAAELNNPHNVWPTADGGFLIADASNTSIRRVAADGTITTVVGNGTSGFSGDGGPATLAQVSFPKAVVELPSGALLVADTSNNRIRYVGQPVAPTSMSPPTVNGTPQSGATLTASTGRWNATPPPSYAYQWRRCNASGTTCGDIGGATASTYVATGSDVGSTLRVVVTATNAAGSAASTSAATSTVQSAPQPPANTAPPTINGTPAQGQTLTATPGTWTGTQPIAYGYQWRRCDSSGGSCADIAGATSSSYTVVPADAGASFVVAVTATNSVGTASASSAATAVVPGAAPQPPVNSSAPTISGTASPGQTLTADPGTWSGTTPITYAYQWRRCTSAGIACVDLAGATAKTYTVQSSDAGSSLQVRVTASNAAGETGYAAAVRSNGPRAYWRFDDSGNTLVDDRGFANGTYINSPTRLAASLLAGDDDSAVAFNGTSQYADVPANAAWTPTRFSIEVVVRPSKLPANATLWSTIGAGFTGWWLNTGPSGEARLFIGDGTAWRSQASATILNAGATYDVVGTYDGANARLYVNGALVATGPTTTMNGNVGSSPMRFGAYSTGPGQYWPGVLDDASFYTNVLTGTQVQAHYQALITAGPSADSAPVTVGNAPPSNTAVPSVSGQAVVGQSLSADPGSWSGSQPIGFAYQWRRCDSSGAGCVDVGGATGQSYVVASGDVGSTLRVRVTGSNSVGSSSADSAATAVVSAAQQSATFAVVAGADDGDVSVRAASSAGYPPSGSPAANSAGSVFTAGKRLAFSNFQVLTALVRFDTSSLPDGATVTGVSLRLGVNAKADGDGRSLVAEWYDPSSWPIDAGDSTFAVGSSALSVPVGSVATGQVVSFALAGPGSVSKTGYTALRVGISGGQPAADNYVQFASSESTGLAGPQLVVTYTTP